MRAQRLLLCDMSDVSHGFFRVFEVAVVPVKTKGEAQELENAAHYECDYPSAARTTGAIGAFLTQKKGDQRPRGARARRIIALFYDNRTRLRPRHLVASTAPPQKSRASGISRIASPQFKGFANKRPDFGPAQSLLFWRYAETLNCAHLTPASAMANSSRQHSHREFFGLVNTQPLSDLFQLHEEIGRGGCTRKQRGFKDCGA